MPESCSCSSFF
uniref:Uncharacterized protein n=1 Tax=Arundo donax TaxID=35708 RepID=A0A0A9CP48_ARUDO